MIRTITLAAFMLFTLSCGFRQRGSAPPSSQPSSEPKSQATSGRYQLLQAHIESVQGKRLQTVLRIDTETGETWALAAGDAPQWRRISDPDLNKRGRYNPTTGKIEWEKPSANDDIDPLRPFSTEENAKRRKEQKKLQPDP